MLYMLHALDQKRWLGLKVYVKVLELDPEPSSSIVEKSIILILIRLMIQILHYR